MPCGLFGKLPAKRDFVALGIPREFLTVWEPWLQGGLAASRVSLGTEWQGAFLRAPIWRFWLGQDLCGFPALGAFMPSVDGVGRYFPLTLLGRPGRDETIPPPELEPNGDWLAAAEEVLLSVLAEGATFEATGADVARMPGPVGSASISSEPPCLRGGALLARAEMQDGLEPVLARLRVADQARVYGGMSYWWTEGGEEFAPAALQCRGMPDPYLYAAMLTGRFDGAA